MKRILALAMLLTVLLGCMVPSTNAEIEYYKLSGRAATESKDNDTTRTYFYVTATAGSSIVLKQNEMGTMHWVWDSGFTYDETDRDAYATYYVYYKLINDSYWNYGDYSSRWDTERYTLTFNKTGTYIVQIKSECDSADNKYAARGLYFFGEYGNLWKASKWVTPPTWSQDTFTGNCQFSLSDPTKVSTSESSEPSYTVPQNATIEIKYRDSNGRWEVSGGTRTYAPGSYTLYPEFDSYTYDSDVYELTGNKYYSINVDTNGKTGHYGAYTFYFKKKEVSVQPSREVGISINYYGTDGVWLYGENKLLLPGSYTIEADFTSTTYNGSTYTITGQKCYDLTIYSDGTANSTHFEFYYEKNRTSNNIQETRNDFSNQTNNNTNSYSNDGLAYDIGIPNLNNRVYRSGDMNVTVLWVQYQMKATGEYYQGDNWDETGNLGNHTMQEIARFMKSRGYRNHTGNVDQNVINELASYLGNRRVPVYVGGFYDHMNTIMTGGSAGSMETIVSNMRDGVARTTTGARWVQTCLSKLGYYNSTIDGKYGQGTENAVNRFQRDYGFVERDYVSLGVARAMLEACYQRGCYLDDLP